MVMIICLSSFFSLTCLLTSQVIGAGQDTAPVPPSQADNIAQRPDLVTRLDTATNQGSGVNTAAVLTAEVEKMLEAGADDTVIKAFVQNWSRSYEVTADHILRLHEIGASPDLLTTLIQRSAELQVKNATAAANASNKAATTNSPVVYPQMAVPQAYASRYPAYTYSYLYPSYSSWAGYYSYPYWATPYWHRPYYGFRHWGYGPGYGHYSPRFYSGFGHQGFPRHGVPFRHGFGHHGRR